MSTLGDALKGLKQVLLLQEQVGHLERSAERQRDEIKALGRDLISLDKRVVRIEAMIEFATARAASPANPALEG